MFEIIVLYILIFKFNERQNILNYIVAIFQECNECNFYWLSFPNIWNYNLFKDLLATVKFADESRT